jgi:hypothetical protein
MQHIPDKSFQLVRYYGWYSNYSGPRFETGVNTGVGYWLHSRLGIDDIYPKPEKPTAYLTTFLFLAVYLIMTNGAYGNEIVF